MKIRYSNFVGRRYVEDRDVHGHSIRTEFPLPHRAMICDLTKEELGSIMRQCKELLSREYTRQLTSNTIFLGIVDSIEEVSNKSSEEVIEDE